MYVTGIPDMAKLRMGKYKHLNIYIIHKAVRIRDRSRITRRMRSISINLQNAKRKKNDREEWHTTLQQKVK